MWKISTGFSMLPISGSSVMIRSMSTLAWMKSPSVLRRTVPLMPMRQCSYTQTTQKSTRHMLPQHRHPWVKGSKFQAEYISLLYRKSPKHELEKQNEQKLPKRLFENKAERAPVTWLGEIHAMKCQNSEDEVRYLNFFNYNKVRTALSWKS